MFVAALPRIISTRSLLLTGLLGTFVLAFNAAADEKKPVVETGLLPLEELRTFTRVYDHVRNGYVDKIDDAQLLEYAI